MNAAAKKIIRELRASGVKACVLGCDVLVELATREQFDAIVAFYGVTKTEVVIAGGTCAETARYESDGVTFHVSEPARKPDLRDWTRFHEARS
jgi:hypothetical protein